MNAALSLVFRGRVSPRQASYFLLLRQKNVAKEKATPLSATPALRYGATCGARVSRGPQNSLRSNSCGPDPRNAPLLGAARRDWETERAIAALGLGPSEA